MDNKIVFMGSPEFALPALESLAKKYSVVGVVTQPDRPAGRGRILTPPPVKTLALSLGIPLIQPLRLREPAVFEQLTLWQPDLIVVAAYGQILKQNVLDLPPYGCLNIHASLLPRWRGAAPIQASIFHGDLSTGVSIMKMDAGVDTGAVLGQKETPIGSSETSGELETRLARLGADLFLDILPAYLRGEILPVPQNPEGSTYASSIKKEEGALDFSRPASQLECQIRAYNPWPGTFFSLAGETIKVHRAVVSDEPGAQPGKLAIMHNAPAIGTSQGWLLFEEVQPSGKKAMPAKTFLNGSHVWQKMSREGQGL